MEIIPPITHTCLFTSFYISHNKYYSYYYIIDIDTTKPVHSDSDSSDLPDIPPPDQHARPLDQSPAQPHTPLQRSPKKNPDTINPSTSHTQFSR